MRVLLDTNVLISAFAARGLCADQMRWLRAEHDVRTGEVNLVELRRVLTKRFKATAAQLDVIGQSLRDQTVTPKPAALLALKVREEGADVRERAGVLLLAEVAPTQPRRSIERRAV